IAAVGLPVRRQGRPRRRGALGRHPRRADEGVRRGGHREAIERQMTMRARAATKADAAAIARIYNDGIDDRVATFETRHRTAADVERWFDGRHPIVIVEDDEDGVLAFAATSDYRARDCYAGIAEFSVYAARAARGRG